MRSLRYQILLLILLFSPLHSYAIDQDKKLHFSDSALIGLTYYYATDSVPKAIGYSMLIGIYKETRDSRFDYQDLKADLLGTLFGVISAKYLKRYTKITPYTSNGKVVIGIVHNF